MVNGVNGERERARTGEHARTSRMRFRRPTVATDGVSAEHGRFSGGVVNVVTKSGGNLFSGSFRDTLNNDELAGADTVSE